VLVLLLALLAGCAGAPRQAPAPVVETPAESAPREPAAPPPDPRRDAVVASAARLLGLRALVTDGRRIGYDCAGVMRAVFLEHGIDLYADVPAAPGVNGVRRIHEHLRRHGHLHAGPRPRRGDLVFFDDTWDFNGDGRANDPLTHVGLVERVGRDGTIIFISRVARGIERYRLNLHHPGVHRDAAGRLLNVYLRRRRPRDRADVHYLAGELWSGFGSRFE